MFAERELGCMIQWYKQSAEKKNGYLSTYWFCFIIIKSHYRHQLSIIKSQKGIKSLFWIREHISLHIQKVFVFGMDCSEVVCTRNRVQVFWGVGGHTPTHCAVKIRCYLSNSDSQPLGLSVRGCRPYCWAHREGRRAMPHACNSATAVGSGR